MERRKPGGRHHPLTASALCQRCGRRFAPNDRYSPLTGREIDVARLVAEGFDNAGIAQRISYKRKKVESLVGIILAKLVPPPGMQRRVFIALWFQSRSRGARSAAWHPSTTPHQCGPEPELMYY